MKRTMKFLFITMCVVLLSSNLVFADDTWNGTNTTDTAYRDGLVGIGTNTPTAKLHIYKGGLISEGDIGDTPVSGPGVRMMWIPERKAFRAGYVDGAHWDNANIGMYSFSAGKNTTASGDNSVAFGYNTTASFSHSTAMGTGTTASGHYSTAMGYGTIASGMYSTVMGYNTAAMASVSTAIGAYSTASGVGSIVLGTQVEGTNANSYVIGTGADPANRLVNHTPNSLMLGFNSDTPTLFVGPAGGVGQTGYVGIGTTTPVSKLELGDQNWIMLNAGQSSSGINFYETGNKTETDVQYGGKVYYNGATDVLKMVTKQNNTENLGIAIKRTTGNVGIGTETPGLNKLHVAGTIGLGIATNDRWQIFGTSNAFAVKDQDEDEYRFWINNLDGKIGIGTTNPGTRLHLKNDTGNWWFDGVRVENPDGRSVISLYGKASLPDNGQCAQIILKDSEYDKTWSILHTGSNDLAFSYNTSANDYRSPFKIKADAPENSFYVNSDGEIGIGTTYIPNNYQLAVDGKIIVEEVKVKMSEDWPDYVFENGYDLMPLDEVEKNIKENKHLPGIPSANDVEKDGVNLGEMQAKLLQKVEELTLYVIDLKNENEDIKKENQSLKERISSVENSK